MFVPLLGGESDAARGDVEELLAGLPHKRFLEADPVRGFPGITPRTEIAEGILVRPAGEEARRRLPEGPDPEAIGEVDGAEDLAALDRPVGNFLERGLEGLSLGEIESLRRKLRPGMNQQES